jgi:glycosyltransferase involved in cell wall biosynthesis
MADPLETPAMVSVVVPTRDRAVLLDQCLASIRRLEGPDLAIELIVCDDGSSDETATVAKRHGARRIETGGRGAAAARNAGMAAATGEFLLFVDDDDVVLPGHIRPQVRLLRQRPELMAAVGQVCNASFDLGEAGSPWPSSLPADGDVLESFFRAYPQIGATVSRIAVRESVGGQDPALAGDQDWDWHLRLALRHRVGFVDVPCLLFRQRPASGAQEEGEWRRLRYHRMVLWRNARRAGWRRMPPWKVAAIAFRQRGAYAAAFAGFAATHARMGERRAAMRSFGRAIVASPPHAVRALLVDRRLRRVPERTARADGERLVDHAPGVAEEGRE